MLGNNINKKIELSIANGWQIQSKVVLLFIS